MKVRIFNANIITMQNNKEINNGEIIIENGVIVFVGKKYGKKFTADKQIDAGGKVVMPGFINAHAHTAMTLMRGYKEGSTLQHWLFDEMIPLEKVLTEKDVYNGVMLGIAEYVKNGITTFLDLYQFPKSAIKAIQKSGMRAVIGLGFHPTEANTEKIVERGYLKYKDTSNRISYSFYAHSVYTNDEAQLSSIATLTKKYNTFAHTHMSENLTEVSDCVAKNNGLTPTSVLEESGFFDVPALVAHAVVLDKEDIDILSANDVSVVSCPASNLKLGSGIAPLVSLQKAGINIALGTDGAASNNSLSMFREMYLASTLQKAQMKDASIMQSDNILKMATVNGAKALNLKDVGMLKEGYRADLIMLDLNKPNTMPTANIKDSIVYSANESNVYLTMVNGEVLYENGEYFIGEKIENIFKNANKSLKEAIKRIEK